MASISVSDETKRKFDELKPDDLTHDEFVAECLAAKRRDDGEIINPSEIADQITKETAASVELAAYRGVREAVQDLHNAE